MRSSLSCPPYALLPDANYMHCPPLIPSPQLVVATTHRVAPPHQHNPLPPPHLRLLPCRRHRVPRGPPHHPACVSASHQGPGRCLQHASAGTCSNACSVTCSLWHDNALCGCGPHVTCSRMQYSSRSWRREHGLVGRGEWCKSHVCVQDTCIGQHQHLHKLLHNAQHAFWTVTCPLL